MFWLLMIGLSMSWLFIIPEIIILILLIIGVGKYEILVTGIDHILSLCYIYISLPSIVDFVSGGETSIYSLVIFSNVIIYIARIIIVSCNKDKKNKNFLKYKNHFHHFHQKNNFLLISRKTLNFFYLFL